MIKMNAGQLRKVSREEIDSSAQKKQDIYIILDDVLDTYNIGSIFRLADAVAAKKVILCGRTTIPPNPRIKKASINTTEVVEWEYAPTAVGAIKNLKFKIKNLSVVAVEQSKKAVPYDQFEYRLPLCLIVGHESEGVSEDVLRIVDATLEIPMFGVNVSLNVMASLGIVLYKVLEKLQSNS